jgi:hypothetical protein
VDFSTSPLPAAVIATRLGLTGLATSAITGTLTLTKTGTTARTATFPDAAIGVQSETEERSADFTARVHGQYVATATLTVTDPTPAQGHEFVVHVRNGTSTVGGTAYTAGQTVWRSYHSGAWANTVIASLSTAQSFTALQTFTAGLTVSSGTTAVQALTATTITASGLVASSASGAFGATALLASERLRVAGGTMGTPGATDVLVAAGKVSVGGTSATSIQTAGGITAGGPVVTSTASNSNIGFTATAESAGTSAAAVNGVLSDNGNALYMTCLSTAYLGDMFGTSRAGTCELLNYGGSSAGLKIGNYSAGIPIIFGGASIEIARFTTNALASGKLDIKYTTASSSTSTGALTVAGAIGCIDISTLGGTIQNSTDANIARSAYTNVGFRNLAIVDRNANGYHNGIHTYQSGSSSGAMLSSTGAGTLNLSVGGTCWDGSLYGADQTAVTAIEIRSSAFRFGFASGLTIGTTANALVYPVSISSSGMSTTRKITTVSAVPASFADLAAVQTWLAAQFT